MEKFKIGNGDTELMHNKFAELTSTRLLQDLIIGVIKPKTILKTS